MLLKQQDLDEIADALVSSPVTYDAGIRTLMLAGLPAPVASGLQSYPAPGIQLRMDLQSLNRMELADGSRPLVSWLEQAARLLAVYRESSVIQEKLEKVRRQVSGGIGDTEPVPPRSARPPSLPYLARLRGADYRELDAALRLAFPTAESLARMVLGRLDERLANITATAADLPTMVFDLIQWAEARGRLNELIAGSVLEAPGVVPLRTVAVRLLPGWMPPDV